MTDSVPSTSFLDFREIIPCTHSIRATVRPPGSKSMTNRALILAAMCKGETVLRGVLDSEDTHLLFSALQQLGLHLAHNSNTKTMTILGAGGAIPVSEADIFVGNSGTTARFLTAMLAFSNGSYRISGKPRMQQRPISDLVTSLTELGANVCCEFENGCPPVLIRAFEQSKNQNPNDLQSELPKSQKRCAAICGNVSSQFLSALLMAAPLASSTCPIEIKVNGELVSRPYIAMTLQMMHAFGIKPIVHGDFESFYFSPQTQFQQNSSPQTTFQEPLLHQSPPQQIESNQNIKLNRNIEPNQNIELNRNKYISPGIYDIEPDASAASYFFAAAAICGGDVTVQGLSNKSCQGDIAFVDCLEKMGCTVIWNVDSITVSRQLGVPLRGISVDMNAFSDTAQTLAVVALFAETETNISHIEHVRFKETDRIADLARELRRFGAEVEERQDGLRIVPPEVLRPASISTYDDHRMAMSFAVAGLRLPGVRIYDPKCTNKTFPSFFEELDAICHQKQ
ncbi:MAG: 3-phosphoshikimate 1-carboxyvinyltransferase [Thermoguttaceae bacterium]